MQEGPIRLRKYSVRRRQSCYTTANCGASRRTEKQTHRPPCFTRDKDKEEARLLDPVHHILDVLRTIDRLSLSRVRTRQNMRPQMTLYDLSRHSSQISKADQEYPTVPMDSIAGAVAGAVTLNGWCTGNWKCLACTLVPSHRTGKLCQLGEPEIQSHIRRLGLLLQISNDLTHHFGYSMLMSDPLHWTACD